MAFSNPERNVKYLGLGLGNNVADFGAGSGFYSLAAAEIVGERGKVYAVDLHTELLLRVCNSGKAKGCANIVAVAGDLESPRGSALKDASIDAVIMSNVLSLIKNKTNALSEAFRVLKPGGKLLFIDWSDHKTSIAPKSYPILPARAAKLNVEAAGFRVLKDLEVGDHHYGFLART